ncbi:unnamed protein product [Mytilus edulis]|uniref:Death domain-containing protein n=1 Tax=Mytilus edulis TaxID=6550 RepID=A0A8S3VCT5_MYTED|nr:unnamed protein product [Mytilus edulis]
MVTGQFGVGKSSLVKLLAGDIIPEGRYPTDGISLIEGRCGLDVETRSWIYIDPETYNALDVVYNKVLMTSVEEVERQESEKPFEQLPESNPVRSDDNIMTSGPSQQPQAVKPLSPQMALFLVVFDGSKQLHEIVPDVLCFPGQHMTPTPAVFLQHWVNSILTYCKVVYVGIPKILFVATHKDKVLMEDVESKREQLYNGVEELFKDHEGRNHLILTQRIFVNARDKTDPEIEVLKKTITDLTFEHPCWGEQMPNACVPLELEIAELVAEGKQILSLEDVEELNAISKVSVLSPDQLKDFLHFNHSLGKIVYFETPQLGNYVIINPLLMVEVMRSFVTDKVFWPKETRMQETFKRMSESGTIRREDLYFIWEQKDFSAILPYKEFIFNILIYLDILAEQRRYDTITGSRLPVENFFCSLHGYRAKHHQLHGQRVYTRESYLFSISFQRNHHTTSPTKSSHQCMSEHVDPQAVQGRTLLFSGFIGLSFDKSHDIVVCVEGNKILLYIVHKTSSGLIVPDIATGVKECLVTTMERISDFYQSTIHATCSQQSPFQIEYSCSKMQCFISEKEALRTNEWVCDKHNLTHRDENWLVWNQDKKKEQCEQNCPGLSEDALNHIPSDNELLHIPVDYLDFIPTDEILDKLAPQIGQVFFQLGTVIGLSIANLENIQSNNPRDLAAQNREVLFKWKKERAIKPTLQVLVQALFNIGRGTACLEEIMRNIDLKTLIASTETDPKQLTVKQVAATSKSDNLTQRQRIAKKPSRIPVAVKQVAPTPQRYRPTDPRKGKKSDKS